MLDVQPFRGLRYDISRVGNLSAVISPPYDVITPEEQPLYYQKSPYNIVRLELGETQPADSPRSNKYTRAADTLKNWLGEGILFREQLPAMYIFEHVFTYKGITRHRWGLTARVRLEDWGTGQVRPHETTLSEHIHDRLNILRSCQLNLSPILGIFRPHPRGLLSILPEMAKGQPDSSVVDHYGVIHNMWLVTDRQSIAELSALCADKTIYILDGHHRYETALIYQREKKLGSSGYTGNEAFNFVMMTLMDGGDPGVIMLPTHRLVRLVEPHSLRGLKERLGSLFYFEDLAPTYSTMMDTLSGWLGILEERDYTSIGLYGLEPQHLLLLMPRQTSVLQDIMPAERSQAWKDLGVSLLHWVILGDILGIDPQKEGVEYTQDVLEAISKVDSGEYQLAFLLNPIPISNVLAVANAGDRLPQKSTYLYPKPPAGLVMHPLWEDVASQPEVV